jgi:hypothetical protein
MTKNSRDDKIRGELFGKLVRMVSGLNVSQLWKALAAIKEIEAGETDREMGNKDELERR